MTASRALRSAEAEASVAIALPHKRVRAATRTRAVAQPAREAPTQIIAFVEREEVVADIQRPEVINVFADPVPVAPPSLVEAPVSFLSQFEKMMEDSL